MAEALTSSSWLKSYSLLGLKGNPFTTHGVSQISMVITKAHDKIGREVFLSAHSFECSAHTVI